MTNDLTLFDQPQLAVPDYVDDIYGDDAGNLKSVATVPSLGYTGKIWQITLDGTTTKLTKVDDEGDEVPMPVMRMVILDHAQRRGRAYYPGNYDPGSTSAPSCWSSNGETPDTSVAAPQSAKCATCPMNEAGSKITDDGREVKACGSHRMLAVVPASKMDMTPLRLKIAVTSDYDAKRDKSDGWFAFKQLKDFLASKNVKHSSQLVVKVKFDSNEAYPKLLFSPDRWLSEADMRTAYALSKTDDVQRLIGDSWTPDGPDGKPVDRGGDAAQPGGFAVEDADEPAAKPAPKEAPEPVSEPKKAERAETPELKNEPETAKKEVSTDVPDELADILAEWD